MAAMTKESVIAGPVYPAATVPVMENNPAPMMTPTPSATKLQGPSTRFSDLLPVWLASASNISNGFLINNPIFFRLFVMNLNFRVAKVEITLWKSKCQV